jgi:hypothetical protein
MGLFRKKDKRVAPGTAQWQDLESSLKEFAYFFVVHMSAVFTDTPGVTARVVVMDRVVREGLFLSLKKAEALWPEGKSDFRALLGAVIRLDRISSDLREKGTLPKQGGKGGAAALAQLVDLAGQDSSFHGVLIPLRSASSSIQKWTGMNVFKMIEEVVIDEAQA